MKIAYFIQKKEDGVWVDEKELGLFVSVDVANEKIYTMIENKKEFWTHYKVAQCIV